MGRQELVDNLRHYHIPNSWEVRRVSTEFLLLFVCSLRRHPLPWLRELSLLVLRACEISGDFLASAFWRGGLARESAALAHYFACFQWISFLMDAGFAFATALKSITHCSPARR
jgi:hypothetical protein